MIIEFGSLMRVRHGSCHQATSCSHDAMKPTGGGGVLSHDEGSYDHEMPANPAGQRTGGDGLQLNPKFRLEHRATAGAPAQATRHLQSESKIVMSANPGGLYPRSPSWVRGKPKGY